MAIKEEERQEFAETKVENGLSGTDVNVRTGMTNDQFDLYQKKDVDMAVEFKDELYDAVKRGDVQKVKELTGWARDASRPDDTIVTDMTRETQENADTKEKEDEAKRQQALNEQNAAASGATGTEGPVDPLMAFMMDPFGLTKSGPPAAETYSGNSIEEAIRRGDWTAAARIMNALRAREQNEKQDFSGDGYVSGHGAVSDAPVYSDYNASNYFGSQFSDGNGNFQPWADSPDGSRESIDGTRFNAATGEITLGDGSTYVGPDGQGLAPELAKQTVGTEAIFAAIDANIDPKTGLPLDPTKPSGTPDTIKPGTADNVTSAASATQEGNDRGRPVAEMSTDEQREMKKFHDQVPGMIAALPKAERDAAWAAIKGNDPEARAQTYEKLFGDKYHEHKAAMDNFQYGMSASRYSSLSSQFVGPPLPADYKPPEPAADGSAPAPAVTTPAAPDYSWAADEWYYDDMEGQDGYGYMSDYGSYYTSDGRVYDEFGYTDTDGGYTWDTGELAGAYQDKNYNYVDAKGDLYLDGNYTGPPDALAKDAPDGGWAKELQRVAAVKDGPAFVLTKQPDVTQPAVTQTVANEDVDLTRPTTTTNAKTNTLSSSLTGTGGTTDNTNTTVAAKTGAGSLYADSSIENVVSNFSQFMGSLTSFLSTSDVTRALNEVAPSSFMDLSAPISTGTASVWGTKFFDPAAINVNNMAPELDPLASIPPTNPYYKPVSPASMTA